MVGFLHEVFRFLGDVAEPLSDESKADQACSCALPQAVEHVVDEIDKRLRLLSGYARHLEQPVKTAFHYIDDLVETVPDAVLCCRSSFNEDPRVNAFFVNPKHIQEVFSESAEVRELFDRSLDSAECWALLCMRREERCRPGISLVGDGVQREVMQTAVSFTDHQIISPGCSEAEARCSLKCCIFKGLLAYIRHKANTAKATETELETQLKVWRGRLQRSMTAGGAEVSQERLRTLIDELEQDLAQQELRLVSLEDRLDFVADVLGNPARYLSTRSCAIRLDRMGIKLEGNVPDSGYEVLMSEIQIASQRPKVGVLVRFLRSELLPQQDFLAQADHFLAV